MSREVADLTYTYSTASNGCSIIGPKCHNCMNKEYHQHSLNDVAMVYVSSPTGLIPFPIRALVFCNGKQAPFTMKYIAENMVVMDCTNCCHISNAEAAVDTLHGSTTSVLDVVDQNSGSNNVVAPRKKKRQADKEDVNKTSSQQDNSGLPSLPLKRIKQEEPESLEVFIIENPAANNSDTSSADNISKDVNAGPTVPLLSDSEIVIDSGICTVSANEVLISKPVESVLVTAESSQIMDKEKSSATIEENGTVMSTTVSSGVKLITVWADNDSSLPVSSDSKALIESESDNIYKQVEPMLNTVCKVTVGTESSQAMEEEKSDVPVVAKIPEQNTIPSSQVSNTVVNPCKGVDFNEQKKKYIYLSCDVPFARGSYPDGSPIHFSKIYNYIACLKDVGVLDSDFGKYIVQLYPDAQNVTYCLFCGDIDSSVASEHRYLSHFLSFSHIAQVMTCFWLGKDWNKFMGLLKKFLLSAGRRGDFKVIRNKMEQAAKNCEYSTQDSEYNRLEDIAHP